MSEPHEFWNNGRLWPSPIVDYVFLAEAMHAIGRARFPISWTGQEPWGKTPLPLPRQQRYASRSEVARAYRLLARRPVPVPMALPPGAEPIYTPLDDHSWHEAAMLGAAETLAAAKASGRWWDVMEITSRLFRIGGMKLFLRPYRGGKLEGPCNPSLWFTEAPRLEPRFKLGMMDFTYDPFIQAEYEPTQNPSDPRFGRQDFRYMYVDQQSLDVALSVVSRAAPPHISIRDDEPEPVGPDVAPALDTSSELDPSHPHDTADLTRAVEIRRRGRPKGTTNWDTAPFAAEYTRRLTEHGEPSLQCEDGWKTKEQAAGTVLDRFYSELDASLEPPSISSAKAWAAAALEAWREAGCPRSS